jgi:hypothetical protein
MGVVQWIELRVGALGNEEVPKLAECLKHQLQYHGHLSFFLCIPTFW